MKAYQLKITIKDSKPPIWRRFIVPAGLSFSQLTVVIHKVMGWWEGHLSEYTFKSLGVKLMENSEDHGGAWWEYDFLESSQYLIDDFLDNAKSFSYLYDFGDDWRHTVQIEKIIEDYEFDYPMVIKFKGDTPPEDCGGIWGYYEMLNRLNNPKDPDYEELNEWFDEQSNGPYDLELVNKELFKFKKTKKKIKPVTEAELLNKLFAPKSSYNLDQVVPPKGQNYFTKADKKKELENALKNIGNQLEEIIQKKKALDHELRSTYGDKNVDDYYEFMEHNDNGEVKVKTIFDYEKWKDVTITTSRHQMQDLMLNLRDIDIKNYMKYLHLPDTAGTKKLERIKKILAALKENPQYYLYMLKKNEIEILLDIFDGDKSVIGVGEFVPDDVAETIAMGIVMGIFEVKEKGSKAEIKFAEDADEVIELIRNVYKKSAAKIYKELADFDDKLAALLRAYGVVDISKIAAMIKDIWGKDVDSADIIKKTYLHCTMPDKVWTATDYLAGESYVVAPYSKAQQVMEYRKGKLSSDIDYKKVKKNDPILTEYSMTDVYSCWEDMARLFITGMGLDPYDISDRMDELFEKTINGCDAVGLFDYLCDVYPTKNPFSLAEYWHVCITCVLDTALPHLMGYSRYEYYKLTGQRPQELPVTHLGTTGKKSKGPNAHLMYLPEDVQWELYEIMLTNEMKNNGEVVAARAETLLEKHPDNLELMAAFADFFLALKNQDRSEFLLRRIKKLAPDFSTEVNRILNMIKKGRIPNYLDASMPFYDENDFSDWDDSNFDLWEDDGYDFPVQQPTVRTHPKVGRNDPCPCGSGKKFKKCCMGKGIYD